MKKRATLSYIHTSETRFSHTVDVLISLTPALIWSVYLFGARVLTICLLSVVFCFLFDYPVRKLLLRRPSNDRFDPNNAVIGLLAAFMLPVAVPLWIPVIGALLAVLAKNLCYPGGRRIFCPYVFSAAALNLIFRGTLTTFTRPLAYFNAFTFVLDEKLVNAYRVISPRQYISKGLVYENGVIPQFIGYAAGCIGEVAVLALMLGSIWFFFKKRGNLRATLAFLGTIFILAYLFPSDDAETSYYVFSTLFSGGITLIAIHALNDGATMPMNSLGRIALAVLCGIVTFLGRKLGSGFEWGYLALLAANAASPFVEKYTRPKVLGAPKKRRAEGSKA